MKEIKITKGAVTLVDDEDYERLNQFNWFYSGGYARTQLSKGQATFMHNELLVNMTTEARVVDHIDGNKLNNQKNNLRLVTKSQNGINRKGLNKNNTSGYKGVHWNSYRQKWQVSFNEKGRRVYIGLFKSKEEAAKAYNKEVSRVFGEFAELNEIHEVGN